MAWRAANRWGDWQMQGGGVLIAMALIIGAIVGTIYGEPSIGLVIGLGAGILLAILLWLRDKRRR